MIKSNPIINNKTPQNLIVKKEDLDSSQPIIIDFEFFMFQYIHCGLFTNFPKNMAEDISIKKRFFSQFLPHLNNKTFLQLANENSHNHIIDSEKNLENVNIIKSVLKKYSKVYGFEDLSDTDNILWQLFAPGGMRVIGFRNRNIFKILFLDPHHLIFKNKVYNQDYSNFIYNEHASYYKHLPLIHTDDEFLKRCIDCPTFNEIVDNFGS